MKKEQEIMEELSESIDNMNGYIKAASKIENIAEAVDDCKNEIINMKDSLPKELTEISSSFKDSYINQFAKIDNDLKTLSDALLNEASKLNELNNNSNSSIDNMLNDCKIELTNMKENLSNELAKISETFKNNYDTHFIKVEENMDTLSKSVQNEIGALNEYNSAIATTFTNSVNMLKTTIEENNAVAAQNIDKYSNISNVFVDKTKEIIDSACNYIEQNQIKMNNIENYSKSIEENVNKISDQIKEINEIYAKSSKGLEMVSSITEKINSIEEGQKRQRLIMYALLIFVIISWFL